MRVCTPDNTRSYSSFTVNAFTTQTCDINTLIKQLTKWTYQAFFGIVGYRYFAFLASDNTLCMSLQPCIGFRRPPDQLCKIAIFDMSGAVPLLSSQWKSRRAQTSTISIRDFITDRLLEIWSAYACEINDESPRIQLNRLLQFSSGWSSKDSSFSYSVRSKRCC